MNKGHWIMIALVMFTFLVILGVLSTPFQAFAFHHPLVASFAKFFFLASIGDVVALRLKRKQWHIPKMFVAKAVIWGLLGIVIYWMFQIFPVGITWLQSEGAMPFEGNDILTALLISVTMNLIFAPTMMVVHRITDTWLDHVKDSDKKTLNDIVNLVNWGDFFTFILLRTIPLFWIPAHTITFLLPQEYRIVFAAVLGIVLGLLLGLFQNKKSAVAPEPRK